MEAAMDIYPPEIAAAQAAEWLARAEQTAADAAIAQIRAIPDCVFTPLVMAQLVAALSSKAKALGPHSREIAQGYLDDCYEDMKGFV